MIRHYFLKIIAIIIGLITTLTIKILMIEDHYLKFNGSPDQIVIAI